jgi:hypothetical protein
MSPSDSRFLMFTVFDVHGFDETGAIMMLGMLARRRTPAGQGACR